MFGKSQLYGINCGKSIFYNIQKMLLIILFSCSTSRSAAKEAAKDIDINIPTAEGSEYTSIFPDIPSKDDHCVLVKCFVSPYYSVFAEPQSGEPIEYWQFIQINFENYRKTNKTLEYIILWRTPENGFYQISSKYAPPLTQLQINACSQDYIFLTYFRYVYSSPYLGACVGLRAKCLSVGLDISYAKMFERTWSKIKSTTDTFLNDLQSADKIGEYFQCPVSRKVYFAGCFYNESVIEHKITMSYLKHSDEPFCKFVRVINLDQLVYIHRDDAEVYCREKIVRQK